MASLEILSEHELGDTVARYVTDKTGQVGLWLIPVSCRSNIAKHRETVSNESWARDRDKGRPAIQVEPLARVRILGDAHDRGFGQGRTMLWSTSNDRFRLADQRTDYLSVTTTLRDNAGLELQHELSAEVDSRALRSVTTFTNGSSAPVKIELLTSFVMSGITPFDTDDAPEKLVTHRFRSVWSAEGRLVSQPIEELHLERSWAGGMNYAERFGQIGSMPVRGWFPTVLVEDTNAGVVWGARLAWPASWQLEIARRFDDLVLAGGLADREFGHWIKTIAPGESFTAPTAWMTCTAGTVDDACERLVSVDRPAANCGPAIERDLPVIYNDWCTSWGEPREKDILETADCLVELGVRYLVIDAGWYMPEGTAANWATTLGDWQADPVRFPHGLTGVASEIKKRGLVPGIWFEPENVAVDSDSFKQTAHLLHRDGEPLTVGVRRTWDLHDPKVTDYLDDRLIGMLEQAGFGYLKLDYSETLGIGVDHPDSLGEGLRRQADGTLALFDRIRSRMPELVIEICSAGGHRLESALLQRSAMSSFSDAHELVEIPIVAAALHRLVLPQQSQIWAVLNADDPVQRLTYSLAATFLGRMCLSGDIRNLSQTQRSLVRSAVDLYRQVTPVIKEGKSQIVGITGASWRHPQGWQAVVRIAGDEALVVAHTFANSPQDVTINLPSGDWREAGTFSEPVEVQRDGIRFTGLSDYEGRVAFLKRVRPSGIA